MGVIALRPLKAPSQYAKRLSEGVSFRNPLGRSLQAIERGASARQAKN